MIWVLYPKNQQGLKSMDGGNFSQIVSLFFLRYTNQRSFIIPEVLLLIAQGKDANH
jgi:hypothetical protein